MAKDRGRIKSSYELALERLGGIRESALSEDQKKQLAEVQRIYESKIAEKKIVLEEQIVAARRRGDAEAMQKLQEDLIAEVAALRQEMEREREKVRQGKAEGARRRRKPS
jgi:transcription initiation factor IIF auxiliary subunit